MILRGRGMLSDLLELIEESRELGFDKKPHISIVCGTILHAVNTHQTAYHFVAAHCGLDFSWILQCSPLKVHTATVRLLLGSGNQDRELLVRGRHLPPPHTRQCSSGRTRRPRCSSPGHPPWPHSSPLGSRSDHRGRSEDLGIARLL